MMFHRRTLWIFVFMSCFLFLLAGTPTSSTAQAPQTPPDAVIAAKMWLKIGGGSPEVGLPSGASLLEPAGQQAAQGIYTWSKVAYQAFLYDNYEVVVAMGDGSNPQRLTNNPANDGRARLNRGATQVVFTSNRDGDFEIYAMNVDGSNLRQVTFNSSTESKPAWSPDGSKIAYVSNETGHYEIYVINADGSGKVQMTSSRGLDCFDPSWSPDGSKIAYVTWNKQGNGYVWIIPVWGGAPGVLHDFIYLFPGDPVWSPDSAWIAFDAANPATYLNEYIYILKSNGSTISNNIVESERFSLSFPDQTYYEDHFVGGWSPDGEQIIFNRIQYAVIEQQLSVTGAFLETKCAEIRSPCSRPDIRLAGTGLDFLPDWQIADIEPPSTSVFPLPPYSRATGFVMSWLTRVDGLAGLQGYNLHYQKNQDPWREWHLEGNPTDSEWMGGGTPGDTYSYKLQAYDEAGNKEPWPAAPYYDARTRLYTYLLEGKILDARAYPLAGATLSVNPAPVDPVQVGAGSRYQAWLKTTGSYTIHSQAPGSGVIADTARNPHSDFTQDLYFPPAKDLLKNGNFELGTLQGWETANTPTSISALVASVSGAIRFTGSSAVSLGSPCPEPCLAEPENFLSGIPSNQTESVENPAMPYDRVQMAVAPGGTVHILFWKNPGLYAISRTPQGVWSAATMLDPGFASSAVPTYLKVTPLGEALAIWSSPADGKYKFSRKPPSAAWESPTNLPVDIEAWGLQDVSLDSGGSLYVLYIQTTQYTKSLKYTLRKPTGVWQPPVTIYEVASYSSSPSPAVMAITEDKTLHFFWKIFDNGDNLYYKNIHPNSSVGETFAILRNGMVGNMFVLADSLGQVHLYYSGSNEVHLVRYSDGSWSAHEDLTDQLGMPASVAASGDVIHAISQQSGKYYQFVPGQGWFMPPSSSAFGQVIAVDEQGILHTASEGDYRTLQRATQAGGVSIRQSLTLPAGTYKPTLSFVSQLRGGPAGPDSYYDVSVTDEISTTQVYTGAALHRWEHHWIDLAAWAGKDITVTFTLHQGSGDPYVYLDLDDISLGSWQTPLIHSVSPGEVHKPVANQVVTIEGENFIQKPSVYIGQVQVPAAQVTWVDENTLEVTLPAGLLAGVHDVKVVNPGGQVALLPGSLRTGWFGFVPLTSRR